MISLNMTFMLEEIMQTLGTSAAIRVSTGIFFHTNYVVKWNFALMYAELSALLIKLH
jgi:hypothetical protein